MTTELDTPVAPDVGMPQATVAFEPVHGRRNAGPQAGPVSRHGSGDSRRWMDGGSRAAANHWPFALPASEKRESDAHKAGNVQQSEDHGRGPTPVKKELVGQQSESPHDNE